MHIYTKSQEHPNSQELSLQRTHRNPTLREHGLFSPPFNLFSSSNDSFLTPPLSCLP